ncbi:hypothetical protein V8E51_004906 [Hyaloscypha variabilis]
MSRQQEGRPPPSDRELMPPPPRPRPPTLFRTLGSTTTPIILSDTESESNSDDEDDSASSTPHASAAGPPRDATQIMLDDLRSVLQGGRAANFCVGGRIPISPVRNFPSSSSSSEHSRRISVTLRFDTPEGSVGRIQFPLQNDGSGFDQLRRASTPSTFASSGRAGGVGELDASHFSVDFHPHDYGIIDTIAQTLLPGVTRPVGVEGTKGREEQCGVRAELRSLNIHSPSSPTPNLQYTNNTSQPTQFGTLIICLPFPHQSGALTLTHKSVTQTLTWPSSPTIHWTAFHNPATLTLPLTTGHLLLLTYTLHLSPPPSPHLPTLLLSPSTLPLTQTLKTLLSSPLFLPTGSHLGYFCTHTYPHTLRNASTLFPHTLKGIDATLFTALTSLGLKATVRPVLGDEAWDEWEEYRMQRWMESEGAEAAPRVGAVSRVGRGFGRIRMADAGIALGDDPSLLVNKFFPFKAVEDILWLNEARHEGWEVQMVNLRAASSSSESMQGQGEKEREGGLMWHYSCVAILVGVPGWEERRGMLGLGDEEEDDDEEEEMGD